MKILAILEKILNKYVNYSILISKATIEIVFNISRVKIFGIIMLILMPIFHWNIYKGPKYPVEVSIWYYLGLLLIVLLFFFIKFDSTDREVKKLDYIKWRLEVVYIFATFIILATAILFFQYNSYKQDLKLIGIKKLLCMEYQENSNAANELIEGLKKDELSNQYFANLAVEEYFKNYLGSFSKDIEGKLYLDYIRCGVTNNKIDRVNDLNTFGTVLVKNLDISSIQYYLKLKNELNGWVEHNMVIQLEERKIQMQCK